MDAEVQFRRIWSLFRPDAAASGQVTSIYIINGTLCARETPDLFSRGYFEILFGLSESHHLLPALTLYPSLPLSLLCCGRPATSPFTRSRARGKFPSGKEGRKRAAATAFLHRFTRFPAELHFQLLNSLPTRSE